MAPSSGSRLVQSAALLECRSPSSSCTRTWLTKRTNPFHKPLPLCAKVSGCRQRSLSHYQATLLSAERRSCWRPRMYEHCKSDRHNQISSPKGLLTTLRRIPAASKPYRSACSDPVLLRLFRLSDSQRFRGHASRRHYCLRLNPGSIHLSATSVCSDRPAGAKPPLSQQFATPSAASRAVSRIEKPIPCPKQKINSLRDPHITKSICLLRCPDSIDCINCNCHYSD